LDEQVQGGTVQLQAEAVGRETMAAESIPGEAVLELFVTICAFTSVDVKQGVG